MSKDTDVQRNAFQLTINNPSEHGLEHQKIKDILITNFTTLQYFCMADEIGKNGTYHTHLYIVLTSRVRISKVKKHFPSAHIEVAKGSAQNNLEYIKKTGKWEGTDKEETKVDGTFEEWGTFPTQKGVKADMQELYEMVQTGYSNAEILAINNDYILHIDKIDKLRTMILTEKYKNTRRLDLRVIYIYGATGTKKTSGVLDKHGDSNVYRVTDYDHPFDGYSCQPVIAFDEFRSHLRISDMLNYMDIYPIELPSRYSNKFACYDTVYIISNLSLEEQYSEVQKTSPESWNAFLRRIHEVHHHKKDGTIDIYNSVEEYMNRQTNFQPITAEEYAQLGFEPFNDKEVIV